MNPADQPVYFLAFTSSTLPLYTVDQYAETLLGQRISMVKGVAQVQVFGAQKYAVRIQLDPEVAGRAQIGIDEVTTAVQNANVNLPTGTLFGAHQAFTVQANGQLTRASLYRPLIVAYRNGSPVRLDELGNVFDSVQSDKISNYYNDGHAVMLAVQRQPGTNTVERGRRVTPFCRNSKRILPPSISMVEITTDPPLHSGIGRRRESHAFSRDLPGRAGDFPFPAQSFGHDNPEHRASDVHHRDVRGDVPPELHAGQSVADGADAFGRFRGGRRDRDARKHRASHGDGRRPHGSSAEGRREIGFTIVSMTLSLAAVFIPVLFMGGIIGRLLHEFSVVIMVAVLVSGPCLSHADADACAADSFDPSTTRNTAGSTWRSKVSSRAC